MSSKKCQATALPVRWQHLSRVAEQEDEKGAGTTLSLASTDENSPLAPLQSLGQGTELEKGGQELKVYVTRKPIPTSAVAGLILHEEGF